MKINYYDSIKQKELQKIVDSAIWVLKDDKNDNVDPDNRFHASLISPVNALAGVTDYKDHREDSLDSLKAKVIQQIKSRLCQSGNYYNKTGKPFDVIVVRGLYGSWEAYCHWSDGTKCFFVQDREDVKERMKKSKTKNMHAI